MRWLIVKDLQILRRSPLLVALLVIYPIVIALMIGFALSSPPGKPKVAFYNEVAPGKGLINLGSQHIDLGDYVNQLFESIQPVKVHSRDAAVAKVRNGEVLAALVIPADLPSEIANLVNNGVGNPTVELILNTKDPVEREYVNQAIQSRLDQAEQAISRQVLGAATSDLRQVLDGGQINFAGQNVPLLGLRASRAIVQQAVSTLPAGSPVRASLQQVVAFANVAIQGLNLASPVLGSIGTPLTVDQTELAGRTTPTDTYAAAIAVVISLMFVAVLLAAGMLAVERSENAYRRLIRGLVPRGVLLSEKVLLSAACAGAVTLLMSVFVSLFIHLEWARFPSWVLALAFGGLAFGALGTAIGAIAREVSAASLLAFLLSLPIAFVALVPANAVSGGLKTVLDAVAFVFPFRAALQAVSNAFSGASPGIVGPLLHLAVLTIVFWAIARVALRRFAS
jgi:ABC-type transport system involved in cytochrome c biogenesis permease component